MEYSFEIRRNFKLKRLHFIKSALGRDPSLTNHKGPCQISYFTDIDTDMPLSPYS